MVLRRWEVKADSGRFPAKLGGLAPWLVPITMAVSHKAEGEH